MRIPNTPKLAVNTAGNYEIRWTQDRVTKRVSCNTKDKGEAEKALATYLLKVTAPKPKQASVGQVLSTYCEEHVDENVSDKQRQEDCIKVLAAGLGSYEVADLTPSVMKKYRDDRRAGKVNGRKVGDGTLRRELNCLVAAINHAVTFKRIDAKDAPTIILPDAPPPKDLWLTESQLDTFVRIASELHPGERLSRLYRFVVVASETAARKNSVLSLRWNQVDLGRRLIHYQNDGNKRTNKRRVAVPMSDLCHSVLARANDERIPECDWVMDTPYSIQHHFEALVKSAGTGFEDVTPHTLRHTWATLAAQAGVPLFEVAGVLGDTLATVVRVYAHHCPDHLRGAVNWRTLQRSTPGSDHSQEQG
jgi:integrase